MDTIERMRTFVSVARQQSFTTAAQQLNMSTALASKSIRQLEARLGAQLFHRTTRSVTLTETGQAYFERCIPLLDQFDELEGVVKEQQTELSGPIRVTASTGFGSRELVEAMLPFQQQHPNVVIDLHLSDQYIALVEEGFDIALRFGQLQDSTLMARQLSSMRVVVYASPCYLEKHGVLHHPRDLTNHNCLLQKTSADPDHWRFLIDGQYESFRVAGSARSNSPRAIAQMAAGGLGVGIGPLYSVEPFLESGELQLLFEAYEASVLGLYAVYPPSRHLTARVRALIDHLAAVYA